MSGDLVELLTPRIRTAVFGESHADYMFGEEMEEERGGGREEDVAQIGH